MVDMSDKAKDTLYRIMCDVHSLKNQGVEVQAVSISPQLATYKEEKEIARVLGISTTEWPGDVESYTLKTTMRNRKLTKHNEEE